MCRITILFPGSLCVSGSESKVGKGTGHVRMDAGELLQWLNASASIPCKEQWGEIESDATITATNAQRVATQTLKQLGLTPAATEEQVKQAISLKGLVIL